MSEKKEFICIVCPNSCRLYAQEKEGKVVVEGARCKRGVEHGVQEYTEPKRMLTTTVAVKGGIHPRLAVISDGEIPKEKIKECLQILYSMEITAPVRYRDVIAENIGGTGVKILASRAMEKAGDTPF